MPWDPSKTAELATGLPLLEELQQRGQGNYGTLKTLGLLATTRPSSSQLPPEQQQQINLVRQAAFWTLGQLLHNQVVLPGEELTADAVKPWLTVLARPASKENAAVQEAAAQSARLLLVPASASLSGPIPGALTPIFQQASRSTNARVALQGNAGLMGQPFPSTPAGETPV